MNLRETPSVRIFQEEEKPYLWTGRMIAGKLLFAPLYVLFFLAAVLVGGLELLDDKTKLSDH